MQKKSREEALKAKNQLLEDYKKINLVDYLGSIGFRLNKEKSSRKWPVMERSDHQFIIGYNQQNGQYFFINATLTSHTGNIIDLICYLFGFDLNNKRNWFRIHQQCKPFHQPPAPQEPPQPPGGVP